MLIIPVIDLLNGQVVHAIKGERSCYRPIKSVLTGSSKPEAILEAYFKLYSFKFIYIADLDAIQGFGNNSTLINEYAQKYPGCEFWVDAGLSAITERHDTNKLKNIRHIIGSENKISEEKLIELVKAQPNLILSMDFGEQGLLENHYLTSSPGCWSKDIIIMMLHRVGSNAGLEPNYLESIKDISTGSNLFFAGGIRNGDDIKTLENKGFKGVLLATALHKGAMSKDDIEQIYDGK